MAAKDPLKRLCDFLGATPPGPLAPESDAELESLLVDAWDSLDGGDLGGMERYKLIGRVEDSEWSPPRLSFQIERHGGMGYGSSRAEMQGWVVDIEEKTATCQQAGFRQLRARAKPLDVEPIAENVADTILNGESAPWLQRNRDGVRVLSGQLLGDPSTPKQTLTGRRKRFRQALTRRLEPHGWEAKGAGFYGRSG